MAKKLTKLKIKKIIKKQMPGFHLVETDPQDAPVAARAAEARSPDLNKLRRRFLGLNNGTVGIGEVADVARDAAEQQTDHLVLIAPDVPSRRGPGPKAMIVNDAGEITEMQG